jgi:hypothetical protein
MCVLQPLHDDKNAGCALPAASNATDKATLTQLVQVVVKPGAGFGADIVMDSFSGNLDRFSYRAKTG